MAQTQNPFKGIYVIPTPSQIIVSADIKSRSRHNLVHYTRVVLDPNTLKITTATCDCEGFTYRRSCWHIKALEQIVYSDELKKKIEEARKEIAIMSDHDDVASWG
jgi:hypothetical protein